MKLKPNLADTLKTLLQQGVQRGVLLPSYAAMLERVIASVQLNEQRAAKFKEGA